MKVKAFTLMEILVVLIISSTVLYAAYFAFLNINLYQRNLTSSLNRKSDILLLHSLLSRDFDRSEIINIASVEEISFKYADPKFSITYLFRDGKVIRSTFYKNDTIQLSAKILEYSSHPHEPVVESIQLQADDFTWFFAKQYDGATLNDIHNGKWD